VTKLKLKIILISSNMTKEHTAVGAGQQKPWWNSFK